MTLPFNLNVDAVISLAQEAGKNIVGIYNQDFEVYEKTDKSPLTDADLLSHKTIIKGLARIMPEIPVFSEESSKDHISKRLSWETYWLIDPLDGTEEFIKRNGEFTVNIALVHKHKPVFGVVNAPVLGVTYWGGVGLGARKIQENESKVIHIPKRSSNTTEWIIVGSRTHQSDEFRSFVNNYPGAEIISMGSSLKLCLIAEGTADLYPRFGLTSEWDTAASQAVVEAAGGLVLAYPEMKPLSCNQNLDSLLNHHFLACASPL